MKKALVNKELSLKLYYFDEYGKKIYGMNPALKGDCTGIEGDCTGLEGDCTWLEGDCTGFKGDCTGLIGNLDDCDISDKERKSGVLVSSLAAGLPDTSKERPRQ